MSHSVRYGITPVIETSHSIRHSGTEFKFHSLRYGITPITPVAKDSVRNSETPIYTQEFHSVHVDQTGTWLGVGTEISAPVIEISINDQNLRPYLIKLSLSRPFNGKSELTCTFRPTDIDVTGVADIPSKLLPPGRGDFLNLIQEGNTSGSRALSLAITVNGSKKVFGKMIPLAPDFQEDNTLVWKFEGKIRYLEESVGVFDDIVWDAGGRYTAHSATIAMGNQVGVSIVPLYPDYVVSRLDRGSSDILGPCDELAKPMQAGRREVGESIYYQQAKIGLPKWKFDWNKNVIDFKISYKPRPRNRWSIARVEPIGAVIGKKDDVRSGFNTINFSPASKSVSLEIKQNNCTCSVFQYFDTAGNLLSPGPESNFFTSGTDIGSCRFICEPDRSATSFSASIIAKGNSRPDGGLFNRTVNSTTLQAIHGVIPERSELIFQTVFDYGTLSIAGDAFRDYAELSYREATLFTRHANPHIEPGDTVSITDGYTDQDNSPWFVDWHGFDWEDGESGQQWSTRLKLLGGVG